ncbi:50S ribosomal protein L15 [Hippea maritima]|uniref:Large ribosomal subunit protein uL15 n=1 Tax=Hippea maritima (strain ATCC 700847 / DSM 10411 / MH2) TaxID=760142 RepID=F2LXS3_HIPMA|nr:50S ribosomal protein L15 [Hippea maritima]AEA34314.1 ribosomal protein L15 [Hippea maritima DSM 10411]
MELYELPRIVKDRKRVGRGDSSGWGTTAGKGSKGEKARSGGAKAAYFEGGQTPIYRRLPKRGFKNPFRVEYDVVNLNKLEAICSDGDVVDINYMVQKGLIKGTKPVKVLGNGELTKKITVIADAFSNSAKEKIEKAGGSIEVLQ